MDLNIGNRTRNLELTLINQRTEVPIAMLLIIPIDIEFFIASRVLAIQCLFHGTKTFFSARWFFKRPKWMATVRSCYLLGCFAFGATNNYFCHAHNSALIYNGAFYPFNIFQKTANENSFQIISRLDQSTSTVAFHIQVRLDQTFATLP
jgi:hypothetical protein